MWQAPILEKAHRKPMSRKLPLLTPDNTAFWQGGAQARLMMSHCGGCQRYFHPPAPICPRCGDSAVAPRAVSGRGQVASFTVNHQTWTVELSEPYVVAIVELDEQPGLRFVTNVVGCPVTDVHIGLRVRVTFEHIDDVWLPLFEKDQG